MTITAGIGNVAKANTQWTKDGHNGSYMAYGYYYDSDSRHYSWATLGSAQSGNKWAPAGETSLANSPSVYGETSWDAGYGY